MKTSDLKDAELDYWVAKALDLKNPAIENDCCTYDITIFKNVLRESFYPSILWSICGEYIQQFNLTIIKNPDKEIWGATNGTHIAQQGETPQIAICRCIVELKFGKEIT